MKIRILTFGILSIIATLMITSCGIQWIHTPLPQNDICSNYPMDVNQLPVDLIHDMVDKYEYNQLSMINVHLSDLQSTSPYIMNDAQSIWFSMETLKKFLYHIEIISKNNPDKSISSDDLGVRIYYASYPDKNKWILPEYGGVLNDFSNNPITEQYEKKHTLAMIPTRYEEGSGNIDFNPMDPQTYTRSLKDDHHDKYYSRIVFPRNQPNPVIRTMMCLTPTPRNTESQNHGNLFPPYPNNESPFN